MPEESNPTELENNITRMVALVKALYDKAILVGFEKDQAMDIALVLTTNLIEGAAS